MKTQVMSRLVAFDRLYDQQKRTLGPGQVLKCEFPTLVRYWYGDDATTPPKPALSSKKPGLMNFTDATVTFETEDGQKIQIPFKDLNIEPNQ